MAAPISLRLAAVLVTVTALARAVCGQAYSGDGGVTAWEENGPDGPFKSTLWLNRPVTDCRALTIEVARSPNNKYALEQTLNCPNGVPKCWVGVRNHSSIAKNDMIWSIPSVNLTLTESCTLRFTKDGDLQLVVSDLDVENGLPNYRSGEVVWNTKTAGKGAVQVQLQDTGNLVLVHKDGETVLWKSTAFTLLPLSPLDEASNSWRVKTGMLPLLSAVSSSVFLFICVELQLFHVNIL